MLSIRRSKLSPPSPSPRSPMLPLLLALVLGTAGIALAAPPVLVGDQDLDLMGCMRLKEDSGGQSCYHGAGYFPGCTGSCGYATFDTADLADFLCDYTLEARVVDAESGRPMTDLAVHLLMPDLVRHSTHTDGDGSWRNAKGEKQWI